MIQPVDRSGDQATNPEGVEGEVREVILERHVRLLRLQALGAGWWSAPRADVGTLPCLSVEVKKKARCLYLFLQLPVPTQNPHLSPPRRTLDGLGSAPHQAQLDLHQ